MVQVNTLYQKIQSGEIDRKYWLDSISEENKNLDKDSITKALDIVKALVDSNKITQKQALYSLETATILASLHMDNDSLIVALFLTSFHDKLLDKEKIDSEFGHSIVELLNGVVKMDAIKNIQGKLENTANIINNEQKADQIRKMFIAMVSDPRVVVIRLADHLCELRSATKASKEQKIKLANETKLIYGPLANRLGIGQIKWELEDLAFRYLESDTYKSIAGLLDEKRIDRDNYIHELIVNIKNILMQHHIVADVSGRVKHIYSIWRKMQRKNLDYHQLYDIRAVRILTNNITECYAALGLVHSLWRHIPKEFDDYIQPNLVVDNKQMDANFFQHKPYLDQFNKEHHTNLVVLASVSIEPMGVYVSNTQALQKFSASKKITDLPKGLMVGVPNDTTNEGRALLLLQKNGLIQLNSNSIYPTKKDITVNPYQIKIIELDPAMLPRALISKQVGLAVINSNYALQAKINPLKDSIFVEDKNSPYVNVIAVRPEELNQPRMKKLATAITSPQVKEFILKKYNGAVIPAF